MNTQAVLTILSAGGVAGIVTTAITTLANRRNLGATATRTDAEAQRTDAETDEIITNSARGLVADLRVEIARKDAAAEAELRRKDARIATLERRLGDLEAREEEQRQMLQDHVAYDWVMIDKLRTLDPSLDLPDPPPLTLPAKRRKRS